MKFDVILINPPYNRSLHLKFLEKVIEIGDKVVSIQPIRWLEDPLSNYKKSSNYKKFEDSISKHINDIEIINVEQVKKYFNIQLDKLAIYFCNENGGYDYKSLSENNIIKNVLNFLKNNHVNLEYNKKDGFRIRIPGFICGIGAGSGDRAPSLDSIQIKNIVFKDGKYNGKWWHEYYVKNQHSKKNEEIPISIKFDTEKEGYNFIKSINTDFMLYVNRLLFNRSLDDKRMIWMGNVKHPRTGTKGYKDEWTNEDFYKFFKIDKDDQKTIKDFIKSFENRRQQWFEDHKK